MQLSREAIHILDSLAAIGNIVEIVDTEGVYVYCSENSNFAGVAPKDMIGRNVKDIYGLTDESSKVMNVLQTGVPVRDYLMSFVVASTQKRYLWLYSAFPMVVDGELIGAITLYKPYSNVRDLVRSYAEAEQVEDVYSAAIPQKQLFTFDDVIYTSAEMESVVTVSRKISFSGMNVLLVGETGTGKQLFAESIHSSSPQANEPFVAVNCASIPEDVLESVLFGVKAAAYLGATGKKGLFEQCENGTIFLDEIQALSPEMQAKLLRVLEYKVVRRIGSSTETKVNPRIITAMNVNPYDHMKAGKLKPDLFYRIAVITVRIPPLRERAGDITLLVNHYIQSLNRVLGLRISGCSSEAMERLCRYAWPGNVRELQHCIDHIGALMESGRSTIESSDLPSYLFGDGTMDMQSGAVTNALDEVLEEVVDPHTMDYRTAHRYALQNFNRQFHSFYIRHALESTNYNVSKAAGRIKVSRQHLHKLIREFEVR